MEFGDKPKATYVRDTFNEIAGRYDLMNSLISLGMDKGWRRQAVRYVGAQPGAAMLDVCCGTGLLALALARAVGPAGEVVGLDFSEKMLEGAYRHWVEEGRPGQVRFLHGDAMSLPFADNSFDGATVGWGLRNLPDLAQGVREMARVVKPGGRVVSLDMAKPDLPGFKQAYWLYFQKLVPLMGKLWAGKRAAYRYLHDSAVEFPAQQELAALFADCGLVETGYRNLAGGVVAIVYGAKPGESHDTYTAN